MSTREQLITLLQVDFDTLRACELTDELIAELRVGPPRTVRYHFPSHTITLEIAEAERTR